MPSEGQLQSMLGKRLFKTADLEEESSSAQEGDDEGGDFVGIDDIGGSEKHPRIGDSTTAADLGAEEERAATASSCLPSDLQWARDLMRGDATHESRGPLGQGQQQPQQEVNTAADLVDQEAAAATFLDVLNDSPENVKRYLCEETEPTSKASSSEFHVTVEDMDEDDEVVDDEEDVINDDESLPTTAPIRGTAAASSTSAAAAAAAAAEWNEEEFESGLPPKFASYVWYQNRRRAMLAKPTPFDMYRDMLKDSFPEYQVFLAQAKEKLIQEMSVLKEVKSKSPKLHPETELTVSDLAMDLALWQTEYKISTAALHALMNILGRNFHKSSTVHLPAERIISKGSKKDQAATRTATGTSTSAHHASGGSSHPVAAAAASFASSVSHVQEQMASVPITGPVPPVDSLGTATTATDAHQDASNAPSVFVAAADTTDAPTASIPAHTSSVGAHNDPSSIADQHDAKQKKLSKIFATKALFISMLLFSNVARSKSMFVKVIAERSPEPMSCVVRRINSGDIDLVWKKNVC
jgi:hypothetical protein